MVQSFHHKTFKSGKIDYHMNIKGKAEGEGSQQNLRQSYVMEEGVTLIVLP